jgi:Fe(3+) dicitrate transport protein
MKTTLIAILLLSCFITAHSQTSTNVSGKVMNNGEGVPLISVYVKDTSIGSTTNNDGAFSLENIPFEGSTLCIRGIGFKTIELPLSELTELQDLVFNIETDDFLLNELVVSGSRVGLLRYEPGIVNTVGARELTTTKPLTANEVLRNLPGVHVVDEEGAGLRTNIGIWGLDPDRSRNVLILEDGIPLALAPYGEPEMYYSPNITRMSGLELLKGHGTILFGPQTVGGVVNYLTDDPPADLSGLVSFSAGDLGYNSTFLKFGNTMNNIGFTLNYNRKQASDFGPTSFLLHDLNGKLHLKFSKKSQTMIKMSAYEENSNATYVGITQAMYDHGGYDHLRIAPDDNLHVRRYAISAINNYQVNNRVQVNTTLFAYTTTRDWNRQDFSYDSTASNRTGVVHGIEDVKNGAVYMRNRTGQRNRQFEVFGAEPRLNYIYSIANISSKLDAGVRYLFEKAYEQRVNGTKADTKSGELQNDEIRTGNAFSSFVQNKMLVSERLALTGGVRTENIWYARDIYRTSGKDTLISNTTHTFSVIPGAGMNYSFNGKTNAYMGIHKGFSPPRTKDAISDSGEDLELEAENSWNYELGLRVHGRKALFDIAFFYLDFSNQIIPVSESSGGAGTGYINGGSTIHGGGEISLRMPFGFGKPAKWNNYAMVNATYVESKFSSPRFILQKTSDDDQKVPYYVKVEGNRTPYAPALKLTASVVMEYAKRSGLKLTGNYIGEQFTDVLNTTDVNFWIEKEKNDPGFIYQQATLDGRIGKTEAYFIADASVWYEFEKPGIEFYFSVKNMLDQRYIASRRPQGIRVGMPRFISGGITYNFGGK